MARRNDAELERLLLESADQAVAIVRGKLAPARVTVRELTARDIEIAPPPTFDAARVQRLRRSMKLSQAVFAGVLNVSPSLVRAWERGARYPEGAPQRLLQVAENDPAFMDDLALARARRPSRPSLDSAKRARPLAAKKAKSYAKKRGPGS
ncbi:MAG: helix-turn-helix domain-containing protein [Gemmatimonadaceae bacterium]|nr:helix-turn-helix domain-containing protein [Gemmatimonadaceae bacterium]